MFTKHPEFEALPDDMRLWRYMDLAGYMDLLLKQQLFFSRADRFEDPYEGVSYDHDHHAVKQDDDLKTTVTINSWHYNKEEDYAMWRIYGKGSYGLAIQTSFDRLKQAFDKTDKPVYIGKVHYYENHPSPRTNTEKFSPFLQKRIIYAYEREVRCCYEIADAGQEDFAWEEQDRFSGVYIDVEVATLLDHIYISPYAPKWFRKLIASVNEKFGLEKEIVHSTVFQSWDF